VNAEGSMGEGYENVVTRNKSTLFVREVLVVS